MSTNLTLNIGLERTFLPDALQPFMFRSRQGRLVVTAQLPVPPETSFPGVYATAVSDDDGQTWHTWSQDDIPGGSPFHEGAIAELRDGTILLLPWSAKGPDAQGNWTCPQWESHDNFDTLRPAGTATFHLPQAKGGFDDDGHAAGEVFLHRTLLELPGGNLLATGYGWFHGDDTPSTYRPSMNKFRSILLRSDNRGRHWSLVNTIACDPSVGEEAFNEPAMVRISQGPYTGRLVVHMRTGSNKTYRHNPIHQCVSDDEGRTWSNPAPLPFVGNVDPDLIEMNNGVLVASFGFRTFESRVNLGSEPKTMGEGHGNYVAFSLDGGDTWIQQTQVTRGPSTCYTSVREIAPGKLLLVYDIGDGWQHVWAGHESIRRSLGCRTIEVSVG